MDLKRIAVPAACLAAAAALLTGCSMGSALEPHSSASVSNTADQIGSGIDPDDITYAQEMMPYYDQGFVLANDAARKSTDPVILALVEKITSERPTVGEQTKKWLQDNHLPERSANQVPEDRLMDTNEMNAMEAAQGAEFDRLWLAQLIDHDAAMTEKSKTVLAKGNDPLFKAIADKILVEQTIEMTQAQERLNALNSQGESQK